MSKGGGSGTVESSSDITPRYRQFADENLVLAGTIANNPYVQYQGDRTAGLSGDEASAFGNVRNMANSGAGQAGANSITNLANSGAGQAGANSITNLANSGAGQAGANSITNLANSGAGQAGADAMAGMANYGGYQSQQAQAALGNQYMDAYQNPYTNQVVNQTINDASRANAINQNQAAAGAAMSGALGGSGAAILAAENNRNFTDTVARESGNLRNLGFTNAAQFGLQDAGNVTGVNVNNATRADQAEQFKAQTQLQAAQAAANFGLSSGQTAANLGLSSGQTAANLGLSSGQTAANLGLQTNDALANAGNVQRGIQQSDLNNQYGDFIDQMNHPLTQLGLRQSALGQTPVGTVQRQPRQNNTGDMLGGVGGLLSGVGAIAKSGLFCWVAREAYDGDPKWLRFREWMLTKAPAELFAYYRDNGERIAEFIADKPESKARARMMMDGILEAA